MLIYPQYAKLRTAISFDSINLARPSAGTVAPFAGKMALPSVLATAG
jgi:hypothetical protein